MNRWLLIWNVILTVLMVGIIAGGCSSIDPQFTYLQSQVERNNAAIEQLTKAVNENRKSIGEQSNSILQLKLYTETALGQLQGKAE